MTSKASQCCAHKWYEVQHCNQECQSDGVGHAKNHQHDEGDDAADRADGEVTADVSGDRPCRLLEDSSHERPVSLGEEPYPGVDVSLFAQDQEEGERQDGYQRGDEPGCANDYISPVDKRNFLAAIPNWLRTSLELLAEPLERPTQVALLRPLKVLRRPLRGATAATKLVRLRIWSTSMGKRIPTHKEQCQHQPQVGEHYSEGRLISLWRR